MLIVPSIGWCLYDTGYGFRPKGSLTLVMAVKNEKLWYFDQFRSGSRGKEEKKLEYLSLNLCPTSSQVPS